MLPANTSSAITGSYYTAGNVTNSVISPPQKQALNYLNGIINSTGISKAIQHAGEAINEVRSSYGAEFLQHITSLSLDDEISMFNLFQAYNQLNFTDWVAFRDYKRGGDIRIKNHLSHQAYPLKADAGEVPSDLFQLDLSLRHLAMLQSVVFLGNINLYSAQFATFPSLQRFQKGNIFTLQNFKVFFQKTDTPIYFFPEESSHDKTFKSLLQVSNPPRYSGAFIPFLKIGQDREYLFFPFTQFLVKEVFIIPASGTVVINLEVIAPNEEKFYADYHQMIFPEQKTA